MGVRKMISLGDFVYGEWIIYDNRIPKYHINIFDDKKSNSNVILSSLLTNEKETIGSIVNKINAQQHTKLSFGKGWPPIVIIKKEESIDLELPPLPEEWVKNIR
ncbi:MAG: uncharacterized protein JWQ66_2671 [Mucilaginibacter sp.]|nr:uncharacterized protein [Mucilaginibacter sp.]